MAKDGTEDIEITKISGCHGGGKGIYQSETFGAKITQLRVTKKW